MMAFKIVPVWLVVYFSCNMQSTYIYISCTDTAVIVCGGEDSIDYHVYAWPVRSTTAFYGGAQT